MTGRRPGFWPLLRQTWHGRRTLSRGLMNLELARAGPLRGTILDLGAGARPSYLRFLALAPAARFLTLDVVDGSRPSVVANVEHPLPFRDASVDVVLLFNVLEHIFEHAGLLREIGRVLRPGGALYLAVPFLVGVHTVEGDGAFVVNDFFRYSRTTLARLLEGASFAEVEITAHGGLFTSAVNLLQPALRAALVWVPALCAAYVLDRLVDGRFPQNREKWVMQYFAVARKAPR